MPTESVCIALSRLFRHVAAGADGYLAGSLKIARVGSWSLARSTNSELMCITSNLTGESKRLSVPRMWSSACELPSKTYVWRAPGGSVPIRSLRKPPFSVPAGVENSKSLRST